MRRVICFALIVTTAGCARAPGPREVKPDAVTVTPVTFATTGSDKASGVEFTPADGGPAVLVLHGDYGLTDPVRDHARRLAEKGYTVLALDLYRGKVGKDIEDAHILSRAIPEEQVRADLKAGVDRLAKGGGKVAVVGWEIGGGYALDLAIADPRVTACVNCYGRLATDPEALAKMKATFLGVFAEQDVGTPAETRADFLAAMKKAGAKLSGLHVLPDCDAGFMTPGPDRKPGPADAKATGKAWEHIDAFLRAAMH